jgi:hypothetical protein
MSVLKESSIVLGLKNVKISLEVTDVCVQRGWTWSELTEHVNVSLYTKFKLSSLFSFIFKIYNSNIDEQPRPCRP